MMKRLQKPRIIIDQLEGSGTGEENWTSIKPTEPAGNWSPAKFTATESGAKLIAELIKPVTVLLGSTNAAKIGELTTWTRYCKAVERKLVKLNAPVG